MRVHLSQGLLEDFLGVTSRPELFEQGGRFLLEVVLVGAVPLPT